MAQSVCGTKILQIKQGLGETICVATQVRIHINAFITKLSSLSLMYPKATF